MCVKDFCCRLTSLLLVFSMALSFLCFPARAENLYGEGNSIATVVSDIGTEAANLYGEDNSNLVSCSDMDGMRVDINEPGVFLKQSPKKCTMYANLMLFRRGAILNGDVEWESITEENYLDSWWTSNGMVFKPVAKGMSGDVYGIADDRGFMISKDNRGYDYLEDRRYFFINYLSKHQEGIVIYTWNLNSSRYQHAILLTDYDASTDTFYCADPASSVPEGRIPLSESSMTYYCDGVPDRDMFASTQDRILAHIKQVWGITDGIKYISNDESFDSESVDAKEQCLHSYVWDGMETDVCNSCGFLRFHLAEFPLYFVTNAPDVVSHQLPRSDSPICDNYADQYTSLTVTGRIRNQNHELWLMLCDGTYINADDTAFDFDKMQNEAYHAVQDADSITNISRLMSICSLSMIPSVVWKTCQTFGRMCMLFAPDCKYDLKNIDKLGHSSYLYAVYYQGETMDTCYTGEQMGNIFYGYICSRVGISEKNALKYAGVAESKAPNDVYGCLVEEKLNLCDDPEDQYDIIRGWMSAEDNTWYS